MNASVQSVNVGTARPLAGLRRPTGIDKQPVGVIDVRDPGPKQGGLGSGVVGDAIGSRKHHGGLLQAVYAVAREELDHWGVELGRQLPDGGFGENLTTIGIDVDAALIGERWLVGEALLEVTGPRVPCATFAAHMGEPSWVKRFAERGRTGAYLAVVTSGSIRSGDPIILDHRPDHTFTVPMMFAAWMGDRGLTEQILSAGILRPEAQAELARRV